MTEPIATSSDAPTRDPRRSLFGRAFRFPFVVLAGGAILFAAIRYTGGNETEGMWKTLSMAVAAIGTVGLLFLWALFASGWNKSRVLIASLFVAALGLTTTEVKCDGDMNPIFGLKRWIQKPLGLAHENRVARDRPAVIEARPGGIDLDERPSDFPGYRGRDRDGIVSTTVPLRGDWNERPPERLWKKLVGGGHAGVILVNGFLFTLEQFDDNEAAVCMDAKDGSLVWRTEWPGRFSEAAGGVGPRSTPVVDEGEFFAVGANGTFVCLDAKTGQKRWEKNLLEDNNNLMWAMSGSPLILGDKVIVNPGEQKYPGVGQAGETPRAVRAYDRQSGQLRWSAGVHPTGYCSPMAATLDGVLQVVIFDGDGFAGLDPASGAELWRVVWETQQGINAAQPLVIDGKSLFVSSGYGVGGARFEIARKDDKWTPVQTWRAERNAMRCKFASPVYHKGYIYGLNDGIMECIDAKTGRIAKPPGHKDWKEGELGWKDSRRARRGQAYGHGQILLAGDRIVCMTEYNELVLLDASPEALKERGRLVVLEGAKGWNNFAIVDGIAYVRNETEIAAYNIGEK